MGLFTEALIDEALVAIARQQQALGNALGTQAVHSPAAPQDLPGPLREQPRLRDHHERVHEQGRRHPVRDRATAIPQAAPAR
jgi:hypothetical protein